MGVYLIVAILIIIYGVGKEWLEPGPPKGKELDLEEFRKFDRTYSLNHTIGLTGNEYLRARHLFYVEPDKLKNSTKKQRREMFEPIYQRYGLEYPDD